MTAALNDRIAGFYDASTPLWLDTWGEHMHHGHYGPDGAERKSDHRAQLDMISEVLAFAAPAAPVARVFDAGCGVGGSARLLALRYGAEVTGVTLSPVQAARGNELSARAGLSDSVELLAGDMLRHGAAGAYDLVWSLESAEHIADKRALLAHFYALLRPGGTLALVTWCHRATPPELDARERYVLGRICELYHLPAWVSIGDYEVMAAEAGFGGVRSADWSEAVAPFWSAVIRSAVSLRSVRGLLAAGAQTMRGAYAMRYMQEGFRRGLVRFGVLRMTKPA